MVYYNPYINGQYNPLYTENNHSFCHCSNQLPIEMVKTSIFIYAKIYVAQEIQKKTQILDGVDLKHC